MPQGITGASIRGFDQVMKNLNVEILAITNNSRKGLIKVAKHLRREMEDPSKGKVTPKDVPNLINTWETFPIYDGPIGDRKYGLRMGYSANYALWVHEMYGAVNWTREGSGAGWFKDAIDRNHDEILQTIADNVKNP